MADQANYPGLYRGVVTDNIDPESIGRVRVLIPALDPALPSWALPCVPIAGVNMGTFLVPEVGARVWVQFEGGDPSYPVWMGGWWGNAAEVPASALAGLPGNPNIVLQSSLQNSIVISDLPGPTGGVMLKSATGATIIVNETGIYIQNGKGAKIVLVGPTVTINDGALVL